MVIDAYFVEPDIGVVYQPLPPCVEVYKVNFLVINAIHCVFRMRVISGILNFMSH